MMRKVITCRTQAKSCSKEEQMKPARESQPEESTTREAPVLPEEHCEAAASESHAPAIAYGTAEIFMRHQDGAEEFQGRFGGRLGACTGC
jgi:hypothetical protein